MPKHDLQTDIRQLRDAEHLSFVAIDTSLASPHKRRGNATSAPLDRHVRVGCHVDQSGINSYTRPSRTLGTGYA
jgi:hypothetical protein